MAQYPPPLTYQHQATAFGQQPIRFRKNPASMACLVCQKWIVTTISYDIGTLAWVICGILLLIGLWLGCCLIPFCINGCKDVVHTCPNCQAQVGKYSRM